MLNRWRLVSFRGGKTAFSCPFTYLNYSCKPDIAKHRLYPWLCYGFLCKICRLLCIFDEVGVLFTYFCLKNAKNVRASCFCLDIITNYYAVIAGTSCSHDENACPFAGTSPWTYPVFRRSPYDNGLAALPYSGKRAGTNWYRTTPLSDMTETRDAL